ncbi:MAG: integrase arm-type DNA-binding domain-containing protein [Sphingomonas bacterium]|nr:integrase arm-type DNA-binding domain-containing protein [Sphingomonas bacterium]
MLTVMAVKNAAPRDKDYKLADSGGLYLHVTARGHRGWRLKYRFGGKEKRLIFGAFPEMTLAEARDRRDEARKQLKEGKDPALLAKKLKLVRTTPSATLFETFARAWYAHEKPRWKPVHADDVITSLERDVFPLLGQFDLADIDEPMVIAVLKKVENRGAIETAHRLRQRIASIYRFAKASGAVRSNPALDVGIVMKPVPRGKRRPALLEIADLRKLLNDVEDAGASPVTKAASRFLALTAQRPGMVRRLRWEQVQGVNWNETAADPSTAVWRVPANEMKQEFQLREDAAYDHEVPLAPQAVDVLRAIRPLTGFGPFAFPSARSVHEPSSENAIAYLYNREGYQNRHCPHGWRSSFSTIMNERAALEAPSDEAKAFVRLVIDLMLAHTFKGLSETERLYNRAAYMSRRREIATEWAGLLLDGLPPAADLLGGPRRRYVD